MRTLVKASQNRSRLAHNFFCYLLLVVEFSVSEMHLWPTVRIRESFKISYLTKLEWNLNRMDSEKKRCSQEQPLLLDNNRINAQVSETPRLQNSSSGFAFLGKEILMVASCFYCCFCCGGNFISI